MFPAATQASSAGSTTTILPVVRYNRRYREILTLKIPEWRPREGQISKAPEDVIRCIGYHIISGAKGTSPDYFQHIESKDKRRYEKSKFCLANYGATIKYPNIFYYFEKAGSEVRSSWRDLASFAITCKSIYNNLDTFYKDAIVIEKMRNAKENAEKFESKIVQIHKEADTFRISWKVNL